MAAHVPRRVFARSFVVTLAAIPACHKDQPSINPPPPATSSTASTQEARNDTPPPPTTAASVAIPAPTTSTTPIVAVSWYVTYQAGKCEASSSAPPCPPGDMCNPPPPSAYACPKNIPLNAMPVTITRLAGSATCNAEFQEPFSNEGCPPNMHCNPPPPHNITVSVPCPK